MVRRFLFFFFVSPSLLYNKIIILLYRGILIQYWCRTLVKKTETIDITPSWESLLPYMLAIYVDGSEESREQIASNFKRMAVAADIGVHYIKQQEKQTKLEVD